MNKQDIFKVVAMVITGLWVSTSSATVEVKFIAPENFSDVRDSSFGRTETLAGIKAHLLALAAKQFGDAAAGKDLLIEVIDIDRAGELEPWRRSMQDVRVMRTISWPTITLQFVVSEGGHEVRRGDARLSDLSYMARVNRYPPGDPIRFEKRMLDEWFASEFPVTPVAARPKP